MSIPKDTSMQMCGTIAAVSWPVRPQPDSLFNPKSYISQRIDMDKRGPVGNCVGCHHLVRDGNVDGKPVRVIEYGMGDFML